MLASGVALDHTSSFHRSFFHLINSTKEASLLQQWAQRLTDGNVLFASVNLAKYKTLDNLIHIFLASARLPIVVENDKQE